MNNSIRSVRLIVLAFMMSLLFSCVSTKVNYQEYLIGQWNTEIQGTPITIVFTDKTIGIVGFGQPIPYTLEDNVLSFEFQGTQTVNIDIVNDDEMTQTNVSTGEVTSYKRRGG